MSIGPFGSKNAVFYDIKMDDFFKAKERVEKISKNSNIVINFKSAVERSYNYMLIDSTGVAYKVDLDNKIETFGKIDDRFTWDNIMNNLF